MNEFKFNDRSWTKAAHDGPLESSVTFGIFEIFYDCLGGKPSAPASAARAPASYLLINTGPVRFRRAPCFELHDVGHWSTGPPRTMNYGSGFTSFMGVPI